MQKDLSGPMSSSNLRYIKHNEIDYAKWDRCIKEAPNSRIYAVTWFLDRTAIVWDALVWGDYEYVMPLTYRKKMGIKYVYQPLFSQQLGIFPKAPDEISKSFFDEIKGKFRYTDILLNAQNRPPVNEEKELFLGRQNFLLPLHNNYPDISTGFNKNTQRNLARSNTNNLALVWGISLEEYLDFKSLNLNAKIGKNALIRLKSIIAHTQYKRIGEIAGVYTPENKLCAAVFFCRWKDRVINMNAAANNEGKELRAMFYLMDHFIENNAGKNLILDFEGSMIPGVARFYKGFGAGSETYYQFKYNRLPWPVNWLKRKKDE